MKKNVHNFLTTIADAVYIVLAGFSQLFSRRRKATGIIPLLLMSCTVANAQSPLTNGDFETWNTISKVKADGWNDNNVHTPTALTFVSKVPGVANNAIRLETILSGLMPVSGIIYNYGNPISKGGAKYTGTGVPKRFKGYYRYSIDKDSAVMYLGFKKNGVVLSMDTFYVPAGTKSSFTVFDLAISASLTIVPDTVLFGAVGGTYNWTNFTTNAKAGDYIELDELSFADGSNTYPFPNGNFDNWPTVTEEKLHIWQASGSVTKTTDKQSGSYAVKLVTQDNGSGLENATLYGSTVMLSGTVDTLTGYYKYIGSGGDKGYMEITFWDHSGSGASEAKGFTMPVASAYTAFSIPLVNTINATDFNFLITSSYNNPPVNGSTLYIDNLQLKKGKTAGIAEVPNKTSVVIYPNPADKLVNISLPAGNNAEAFLTVHNSLGQIVYDNMLNDGKVDISNWQSGIYIFTVQCGNNISHQSMQVLH